MPRYVPLEKKASCTVTFRLTTDERRLLEHLAEVLGLSQTDLVRELIRTRAGVLGIEQVPPKPRPRRGRPRVKAPAASQPTPQSLFDISGLAPSDSPPPKHPQEPTSQVIEEIPIIVEHEPVPQAVVVITVSDLLEAFREHFSSRAEGTRRELEDALRFFTDSRGPAPPMLAPTLALASLDCAVLTQVREQVRAMDERVARKNLHLTYLRMMLQFGARDPRFALPPHLAESIPPLTAVEVATGLFKGRPPSD